MNKHYVLLMLLVVLAGSGRAQNFRLRAFTVSDGLSQGYVSCLFQDSRGFIWIGTYSGLNRYDGYQIKRYAPDITEQWALKASFIYCVAEDRHGLLWIGTEKGVVLLDPHSERFVHLADDVPELPEAEVSNIVAADDGRVWASYRSSASNSILVVQAPADLLSRIRSAAWSSGGFAIRAVRSPEGIPLPLNWGVRLLDSTWLANDIASQVYRVDPATLIARPIDPRTLRYRRHGHYGLLFFADGQHGFVFKPSEGPDNHPERTYRWSPFTATLDSTVLLVRPGTTSVYQMDALPEHQETPGHELLAFYQQYPVFVELDKPASTSGMVDKAGNLWIGTAGYGVRKISREKLTFKQYLPEQSFYNFTFLPDGRVWPGIFQPKQVLNLQTGLLEPAPWLGMLWPYSVLVARNGDWWLVNSEKNRLFIYHKKRQDYRWTKQPLEPSWQKDIPPQLLEDTHGAIWIAGNQGEIFRIRDDRIDAWNIRSHFPKNMTGNMRSTAIAEDRPGNLWIGTNYGLVRVANSGGEPSFRAWHNASGAGPLFKNDWIMCLYPDQQTPHRIWVGLRGGGLALFDTHTQTVESFTEQDGLANNLVYGILPDAYGDFWLSTNRGLSRFDPASRTFVNFQDADLAINTEFNTMGFGVAPAGELVFGSTEGLFLVTPEKKQHPAPPIRVSVTDISVNGKPLEVCKPAADGCLRFRASDTLSLRLPHDQNNLLITFAAAAAADPSETRYRYRVQPRNKHWSPATDQRTANLVGLAPGNYVLEIQAKDPSGTWDAAPVTRLNVCIAPPWYRSTPAYIVYALTLLLLLWWYRNSMRKRLDLERTVERSREETAQLKALDEFKNRFFTYISHEFKTPLTIIIGMAERLRRHAKTSSDAEKIAAQGHSMLELVNQMVDIARIDDQQLRLNMQQGNFSHYIRYLVEAHRPLADFRNIGLDVHTVPTDLVMDFDPPRLRHIVGNLLSNAIRHTPSGGTVQVRVEQKDTETVQLAVRDTGAGIPPKDLPHIFERHFRGETLSDDFAPRFGLGLAFVQDLVSLFRGTIAVESALGQGTTFTVRLPINAQAAPMPMPPAWPKAAAPPAPPVFAADTAQLPLLLVVEDNPVVFDYLRTCLQEHFRLLLVADGNEGWETALREIPDLVLTDVMLPGMDGLELTRRIKAHPLTNHIPIVALSARADLENRLEGQEQGADAYLGKPFHDRELVLTLQNLHAQQRRWQERYATLQHISTPPLAASLPDASSNATRPTDAFMLHLYGIFEKNYTNEGYDLTQLCRDIEISKSQLQRKLAALSDRSAMELLRQYRLQRARTLLEQNPDINIREVCFQVGFKDPAHFSRMFSKVFGMVPSEIKKTPEGK